MHMFASDFSVSVVTQVCTIKCPKNCSVKELTPLAVLNYDVCQSIPGLTSGFPELLAAQVNKMAAKQVVQTVSKAVTKPLLSTTHAEARRRVFNLYRAWWREVLFNGIILVSCTFFVEFSTVKNFIVCLSLILNLCERI